MLNKAISTPLAIGIILIVSILIGGIVYWQYDNIADISNIPEIDFPEREVKDETTGGQKKELLEADFKVISANQETGWKIGRSENFGFEIEYPSDLVVEAKEVKGRKTWTIGTSVFPMYAIIYGFPNTSASTAHIKNRGFFRNSCYCGNPPPSGWTNTSIKQVFKLGFKLPFCLSLCKIKLEKTQQ